MNVVALRAVRGHAIVAGVPLTGRPPSSANGLPAELVDALQEWARIVATLPPDADPTDPVDGVTADAVSRRGRHLAARLSVELGIAVDYDDPVTGHRVALRAVTPPPPPPSVIEPTPWGTGLALAALVAGLVLLANLALAAPLIAGLGALGLLLDAAVVAGLAPALWLNRHVPTWRWAVYGTFAGSGLALVFLAVPALR